MRTNSSSSTRRAAVVTLVLVYAVILAGSIVRSTGAGMGCPDWPKCFGHYIPPTHISELQYEGGRHFKAGHFIIWQNALWKAKHELVAGREVNPADWEKYTKHDYAVFNAAHTWTEYINRLMGALLGVAALVLTVMSLRYWRSDRVVATASIAALLLIGFEAWLGALVVESNLAPVKITTHMLVALVIVGLVLWIVRRLSPLGAGETIIFSKTTRRLLYLALALTLIQTVLGTQVREDVDLISELMGEQNRALWLDQLGAIFKIHRSFAIVLLLVNGIILRRLRREDGAVGRIRRKEMTLALTILVSAGTGIILAWFGMPAVAQPAHLVLAMLLFGVQLDLLLAGSPQREQPSLHVPDPAGAAARIPAAQG